MLYLLLNHFTAPNYTNTHYLANKTQYFPQSKKETNRDFRNSFRKCLIIKQQAFPKKIGMKFALVESRLTINKSTNYPGSEYSSI